MKADVRPVDEVLNSPRLLNLPLLLLANKQDNPASLSVSEIRESFDAWYRAGLSKHHPESDHERPRDPSQPSCEEAGKGDERSRQGHGERWDDGGAKEERMASLDVMGVSALQG